MVKIKGGRVGVERCGIISEEVFLTESTVHLII